MSKQLPQSGSDDEGILGFLLPDIYACEQLTRFNRCRFCKKGHASVWCDASKCKQFYHVPCGMKHGCLFKFTDEYQSFCPNHHDIDNSKFTIHGENDECLICQDPIGVYSPITSMPSCCNLGWFHRTCIKQAAVYSALLLHCPLCGDDKQFYQNLMTQRGIFIPHQDAAWERTRSAFAELLVKHNRCDAEICQCEKGQHFFSKRGDWKIIVCKWCGSKGTHKKCSNLKKDMFECEDCVLRASQDKSTAAESQSSVVSSTSMQEIPVDNVDIDDLSDDEQSDDERSIPSKEVVWKLVQSDLVAQKPLSWCLVKKNRTRIADPYDREKLWRKMSKRRINHFFRSKFALQSVDKSNLKHYHYPKNDGWTV